MRIVVNDIAASSGGALSILKDFYEYVNQNERENEWIFLTGGKYIEEADNIKVIVLDRVKASKLEKLKFDFIYGKKFIEKLNPDIVFSLQNIITFGVKVKQAVYVHQPLPFQDAKRFSLLKPQERKMAFYQYIIGYIIKMSIKKADKVIVQTRWMREAVINQTGIDSSKIANILPCITELTTMPLIDNGNTFFYPSSDGIYKNNECIYKANEMLLSDGYSDYEINITIDEKEKYPNINFLGRIPRDEVVKRYAESVLIFPSYIETFGYPLAEARRMGILIFASHCEFSRELLDGYENAYFFDPFNPNELACLMRQVIDGEITRKPIHENTIDENTWRYVVEEIVSLDRR